MNIRNKTLIAALGAGSVALFVFAGAAQAQYKGVGDHGIAACPKVRAQLDDRKARLNTAPATVTRMAQLQQG